MAAHLKRVAELGEARRRQYAAEALRDTLAEHALTPSAEQAAFIAANARPAKVAAS
jgi:hypothetical protein